MRAVAVEDGQIVTQALNRSADPWCLQRALRSARFVYHSKKAFTVISNPARVGHEAWRSTIIALDPTTHTVSDKHIHLLPVVVCLYVQCLTVVMAG